MSSQCSSYNDDDTRDAIEDDRSLDGMDGGSSCTCSNFGNCCKRFWIRLGDAIVVFFIMIFIGLYYISFVAFFFGFSYCFCIFCCFPDLGRRFSKLLCCKPILKRYGFDCLQLNTVESIIEDGKV